VSDCRAAPIVDKRAPIRMIHLVGKASRATVRPPEAVPNLEQGENSTLPIDY